MLLFKKGTAMRGATAGLIGAATFVVVGCGAPPGDGRRSAVPPSTASEVLAATVAAYATVDIYSDSGDVVSVIEHEDGSTAGKTTPFQTDYVRDEGLRFVFGPEHGETVPEYTILRNGSRVVGDFYLDDAPVEWRTMDEATGAAAGVTEGASMLVPPLLSGHDSPTVLGVPSSAFTLRDDAVVVDGVECFELDATGALDRGEIRLLVLRPRSRNPSQATRTRPV